MAAALVTWDRVKRELGLSGDDQQTLVMEKAVEASALVLRRIAGYITRKQPMWDDTTDPAQDQDFALVQAAVLAQTLALYRFRGDDDEGRERAGANMYDLDPVVVRIVSQLEDPTCA
jgi:ribosomal protein S17E